MSAKRILLVQDEKHIAEGIILNLEQEGYEIVWASDGNQALEYYSHGKYDLIILDIMLPGIDGLEVCRRIRNKLGTEPIMFLTARDSLDDKKDGLTIGADDYITKPYEPEDILSTVRRSSANRSSTGSWIFSGGRLKRPGDSIRSSARIKKCLKFLS